MKPFLAHSLLRASALTTAVASMQSLPKTVFLKGLPPDPARLGSILSHSGE